MWLPRRRIRIPRERIRAVDRVRTLLGKKRGRVAAGGCALSMIPLSRTASPGFVRDLPAWEAALGSNGIRPVICNLMSP